MFKIKEKAEMKQMKRTNKSPRLLNLGMSVLVLIILLFAAAPVTVSARGLPQTAELSFRDDFNSSTLDPAWQVFAYTGARVYGYTSPANHMSLTDQPGYLRYSLDQMTHADGFLNNHQVCNPPICNPYYPYDAGLDLSRPFGGENWVFESKASYYMPDTNGRGLQLRIYFGDGGVNTYYVNFARGRDVSSNAVGVALSQQTGSTLSDVVQLTSFNISDAPADTYFYRLERASNLLTASWSLDGVTWNTAFSQDMGTSLDGLSQQVVITGNSWFIPAGSYADYDYVSLTSTSEPINLALNTSGTGFPSPLESDPGWGGGSYPWEMLDGNTFYTDTWAHGLAFTGGTDNWAGQPCGWRQATVNFGAPQTFNRVLVWHHGDDHIPTTYLVEYWDGANWLAVDGTSTVRQDLRSGSVGWGSVPTETIFPTVTGSKVRFRLNNCNITHGWIYQFDVYNTAPSTVLTATTPSITELYPGDPVSVDLNIQNASNLYAAQATCSAAPTVIQPQSAVFGNFFDPVNRLVGANNADAAAGTWTGAISQRSPALPLAGDGPFATITYTATGPGTASIDCGVPLFSDRDGLAQDATSTGVNVTVLPFAAIDGKVTYQGRSNPSSIQVTATGVVTRSATTDASGNFAINTLKTDPSYAIRASAAGYLSSCTSAGATSGGTTTLPATVLKGGNANGNDAIDIGDATLVAANFGLHIPPGDVRADINGDGVVDVRDLAILGGNYGLSGCQPWQ
jgi:hypothetical protein